MKQNNKISGKKELAIFGGKPIRSTPFPMRSSISADEKGIIYELFEYYENKGTDPGYQGKFEKLYTDAFVNYMGSNGYADAVCSGTAAVFVALSALQLPKKSKVLVSPVTDPGTINAIILNNLVPVLADSESNSYNVGPNQIKDRITTDIKAAVIVHIGGKACSVKEIADICLDSEIMMIEDCSQAHGASYQGKKVGTFGDIAVFSTMYRKSHVTGGCGGIIFTKNEELMHMARAFADRGKPYWKQNFDDRNPNEFLFPALNLNQNEISCAIGLKSLERLDETISKRKKFLKRVSTLINESSQVCFPQTLSEDDSPFFHPIFVKANKLECSKIEFARSIQAEGITINPHYQYVVSQWPWVKPYLGDDFPCCNAVNFRDSSFNLLLNENYGESEAHDICNAINKVEKYYLDIS